MSQQPPPPPYGGPPGNYPPGNDPPAYPPQGPGQPRDGMSNKAKFWIGVALTIPVAIVCSIISGGSSAIVEGVGGDSSVGAAVAGVVSLGQLGVFIAAIVVERTRWFALGVLAGGAVLLILAAGACIVLLVAFANSFS
jgi:hypothetical protein